TVEEVWGDTVVTVRGEAARVLFHLFAVADTVDVQHRDRERAFAVGVNDERPHLRISCCHAHLTLGHGSPARFSSLRPGGPLGIVRVRAYSDLGIPDAPRKSME